ncbi:MAG: hypothetical protein N2246_00180, partial [Candidatus Sumerlaeia bacterium]|nr:hypothetical protein [Candidatus Sumerlaeia bacterium]
SAASDVYKRQIMEVLNETQYNISRQLKELKYAGLVCEKKHRRFVFYSLIKPKTTSQRLIIKALTELPESLFSADKKRLKKILELRKGERCIRMFNEDRKKIFRGKK